MPQRSGDKDVLVEAEIAAVNAPVGLSEALCANAVECFVDGQATGIGVVAPRSATRRRAKRLGQAWASAAVVDQWRKNSPKRVGRIDEAGR